MKLEGVQKRFSEELKRHVVSEVESGKMSVRDAAERTHSTTSRIYKWLEEYGRFKPKRDILEVVMKSEQDKIRELEKALSEAHLKLRVYDKLIDIAGKKYRVDLKKTFGTELLELSNVKQGAALKKSAKRSV